MRRALNEIVGDLNHLRVDFGVRLHQEDEQMRATNDNCRCVVCRVGHDMVTYLFDQNVVDESVRVLG